MVIQQQNAVHLILGSTSCRVLQKSDTITYSNQTFVHKTNDTLSRKQDDIPLCVLLLAPSLKPPSIYNGIKKKKKKKKASYAGKIKWERVSRNKSP